MQQRDTETRKIREAEDLIGYNEKVPRWSNMHIMGKSDNLKI